MPNEETSGIYRATIENWWRNSHQKSLCCGEFMVGEYKWEIICYPRGRDGCSNIAFYLLLKSEGEDVKVNLRFSLVDPASAGPTSLLNTQSKDFTFHNKGDENGFSNFMTRSYLESTNLLRNDSVIVEYGLKIIKPRKNRSISVPPSNMKEELYHFLQSGEGTDVSFKLKGENFPAHRSILAARSSVFRAELLGSMRESQARCIEINDMEPQVFKALLQFVYTDELLPNDEHADGDVDHDIMAQHLFVAADRYDLKRLRLICEKKLAERINSDNAVTILALAAQHNCQELKEICLDFISSSENLESLVETDAFSSLVASCASIYKELLLKVAGNRRIIG